jgi:hypothetical protein
MCSIPRFHPWNLGCFIGLSRWGGNAEAVMQRRRAKHTTSLAERIAHRVAEIRALADRLPEGSRERERLIRRVRRAATVPPACGPGGSNDRAAGDGGTS